MTTVKKVYTAFARIPAAALLGFAVAHVAIFAGLFRGIYAIPFSGTGLFYDYAGKVLSGGIPYRDFVMEYPPFALVFFTAPRILGESFRWYYVFYQTEVVVFDLVIVAALYAVARHWRLGEWRVLAVYTIVVLAVGPITLQQYDIFPATLSLLALVWFCRQRPVGAGAFLGLAIMTKVYPLLLAPVFVLLSARTRSYRNIHRAAVSCAATCIIVILPWLVSAPRSLGVLVSYHAKRGAQIESTYGSIALALHTLVGTRADAVVEAGAWSVAGPVPQALARASTLVLIVALGWCYASIWREGSRRTAEARTDILFVAQASALVLAASIAASKVFSPQYLIWVMPFMPFADSDRRKATWMLFALIGVLTYCIAPVLYPRLLRSDALAVALLVVRNGMWIWLIARLRADLRDTEALTSRPFALGSVDPARP